VAAGPDHRRVGLRDEELLRKFVACRDAGDGDGARHWWGELVTQNFDRVRGMVDARAHRYGLSADERQEATQLALVKLWRNMVRTFKGTSMGEWVNSTKQLVEFSCQQTQRDAARRTEHETTLEMPTSDPEDERVDWRSVKLAQEEYRRDQERGDASGFFAWALPQVTNERRRVAVEDILDGVPAEDTAARLGIEVGNLYQLRTRGLKDLRKLRDQWYGA